MKITDCKLHTEYQIASILATEEDMKEFLFTLGCYPGERIVLISRLPSMYVVDIKNSRYSIDDGLAKAISVRESGQPASVRVVGNAV